MSDKWSRVLLVEDNSDDVHFFRRAWAKLEVEGALEVAEDGEAAIDRLSREPRVTHVVLDLKLPRRTGLEVLAWLRSLSDVRSLPVVVLTSSTEKVDQEQASRLGVDAYLIKPVDFAALRGMLQVIVSRWGIQCVNSVQAPPAVRA